ncbi:MAG: hypothetical protein IANPNBLG_04123 [Bryobacteraceae bacterium]|nr:hypothetical protein [Bryobacteraceae bacterium]
MLVRMGHQALAEYYRFPWRVSEEITDSLTAKTEFFFKDGVIYFGLCSPSPPPIAYDLDNGSPRAMTKAFVPGLPFDLTEIITYLQCERYVADDLHASAGIRNNALIQKAYYFIRPFLSVNIRKHLQRLALRGWQSRPFPKWPVDLTVERLLEKCLMLSMKAKGLDTVPFIWFWPEGHSSCAILTHDVETETGRRFTSSLMDIDDTFGMKASFQVVPEERYTVTKDYLDSIRSRGFEVNVQDLNHDGLLYSNRDEFLRRASKINQYVKEYQAQGFRAGALYRNIAWYDALEVSYDMSVPNCAHLDPQHGGCCTVFPYFIGDILELPVTTIQDYSLFHILNDYSIDLWKQQLGIIMGAHGMANIIVHPDYIIEERPQKTYRALLEYLSVQRDQHDMWIPLPHDVNLWWRQRSQMKIVADNGALRIEGEGMERARIAYAHIENDHLVYSFEDETGRGNDRGEQLGKLSTP